MSLEEQFEEEEIEAPEDELEPVSVEDRAKAMGWKPLPADPSRPQPGEYRGDPRRWTDAEEFIRHGEAELPILRDQNRRMSERLARTDSEMTTLRNTVAEQNDAVKAAMTLAKRADERGYQRARAELKAKAEEAVDAGDRGAYDQVQEQIEALESTRAEVVETPPPPPRDPPPPQVAPEITQFIRDNAWFNDAARPYLKAAMIGMHNAIIAEAPQMPVGEQLERALDRMEAAYPEIATEEPPVRQPTPRPRARAPSALAPTAPPGPRRAQASPIDSISDVTERAACRAGFASMKRQDPDFTEAEYMAIYEDPHADVLELRRQRKK